MKAGAYHTLEIEPQRPFEVTKQSWDALDLDRLKQACDPAASADLAAVLITVSSTEKSFILFSKLLIPALDLRQSA